MKLHNDKRHWNFNDLYQGTLLVNPGIGTNDLLLVKQKDDEENKDDGIEEVTEHTF